MLVRDTYWSYQGTGTNTGIKQLFVRLAGCAVKCPIRLICDEQESLLFNGAKATFQDVLNSQEESPTWVHFTGGEPLHYRDEIHSACRENRDVKFQIQTSGMLPFTPGEENAWITCSPKCPATKLSLDTCNEVSVVAHAEMTAQEMTAYALRFPNADLWCCPLYGESAEKAISLIEEAGCGYRLTSQAHKTWRVR